MTPLPIGVFKLNPAVAIGTAIAYAVPLSLLAGWLLTAGLKAIH